MRQRTSMMIDGGHTHKGRFMGCTSILYLRDCNLLLAFLRSLTVSYSYVAHGSDTRCLAYALPWRAI